jgi:Site-specific recombinases, DNA invertase Pin homologs
MTTETCAGNIGIYLRISDDRDGTQTATKRQLADCQRFATSKGWHVADVFEDVDTSAYQRTSKRPEFERMLASVRDGAIDGVLAWKMDRLSRRQRDLVRLDEQCEDSGGFIATVSEQIDTRQPSGRFVAELLVSQARMESSNTSIRVTRAHEQMAKNGQPVLGGMRPFGYSKDRSEIIPQEAELIRDAARRVMAGESVRSVCRDWQAQGVVSSAGKPWKTASLSRLLGSAFISGQRDYQGAMTPGKWPAIITPAETATLRGILADPGRRKIGGWARTYLLTGLIRCGLCHEPLIAKPTATHVRRYVCAKVPGMVSCGRLARAAQPVEDMITEAVFQALDGADIAAYVRRTDREADEVTWQAVAADEAALEELARDFYTDKAISRAEFFAARGALQGRLEQNRKSLARASRNEVLSTVIGRGALDLRKLWAERPLD